MKHIFAKPKGNGLKFQRRLKIQSLFSHSAERTGVDAAVPSLNILRVFLVLFIPHKIFSKSTVPPEERETRLLLMDLPTIKFKKQQFLHRGEGVKRESLVIILKYHRNIF